MESIINQVQALRTAHGLAPLTNPKKLGKIKLEAMILKLAKPADPTPVMDMDEPEVIAPVEAVPEVAVVSEPAPKVKARTIKDISCELLCEVKLTTDEGRTVGHSYQDVLEQVLAQKPGAKTSLNCLRWYAGKIRVLADGYFNYKLPQLRERPISGDRDAGESAMIEEA